MTLLNRNQRAFIVADTMLDPILLDRCVDAFDALIDRGDVEAYKRYMSTAVAQMGFDRPVRVQDRPTAIDKAKTLLIHAYAREKHCTFIQARGKIAAIIKDAGEHVPDLGPQG